MDVCKDEMLLIKLKEQLSHFMARNSAAVSE